MATLPWNLAQRAQGEGQRQQEAQQRARADAQRREQLKAELPYWRGLLTAIGPAIEQARAEHTRLVAEKDAAYARYYFAYYRATGGNTPTQGTGEVVLLNPMEGMAPEALASLPARAEWEAYSKAEKALQDAHSHLRQLEADRRALEHNVALCEQA